MDGRACSVDLAAALTAAAANWQTEFPGVSLSEEEQEEGERVWRVNCPKEIDPTHEEHFSLVLEEFLDHVGSGSWPQELCSAIGLRYTLLAHGHALAEKTGGAKM